MSDEQKRSDPSPSSTSDGSTSPVTPGKALLKFLKALIRWIGLILEAPFRYLFGRDIFISYARKDAANYSQQLAIELRGRVSKLSFYLDQWASVSGTELSPSLKRALRWSRLLVLVGTEGAIASPSVRAELKVFFNKKGRFVPIDVDNALGAAILRDKFLADVCGPGSVKEQGTNVANSKPSEAVIKRVENAVNFTRQDQRLRRAVVQTTIGIIAVIVLAYVVSLNIISDARSKAEESVRKANEQTSLAKEQQLKALLNVGEATVAASTAKADQVVANILTRQATEEAKVAEEKRKDADNKRQGAERLRDQARAEAAKQQEIAIIRQRANQAESALREKPEYLAHSASLAVEAMSRADAIGLHALEADTALRGSLALLPRSLGSRPITGAITAAALSPDANHLVAVGQSHQSGASVNVLQIQRVSDGKVVSTIPPEGTQVAISNNALRVATLDAQTIHVKEVSGKGRWDIVIENGDDRVTGMALSPDGKYLALALRNADADERQGFAEIWEVESRTRVVDRLNTGYIMMESIAFSSNGHLLAIGGIGIGPRGQRMGRALLWDITNDMQAGKLTKGAFRNPIEWFQDEQITAVAPGLDSRYLATAGERTAVVLRRTNRSGYQEVARMPLEQKVDSLAFSDDGKKLLILSDGSKQGANPGQQGASTSIALNTWESAGHWEAASAPHTAKIKALAFQSGGKLITTVSDGYDDDKVRVWKSEDGAEVKSANLRFDGENEEPESLTSDGRYVVTKQEGVWHIWDVQGRRKIPMPSEPEMESLNHPSLSPDGKLLAFIGKKREGGQHSILSYRLSGNSYVRTHNIPLAHSPAELSPSLDGGYIAVLSDSGLAQVFDLNNGRNVTPKGIERLKDIESLKLGSKGTFLAVLLKKKKNEKAQALRVSKLYNARELASLKIANGISSYTFSPRDRYLLASYADGSLQILDVRTGRTRSLPKDESITKFAFSADDRFLAIANSRWLVKVIEVATGEETARLQHNGFVTDIVFSSDGKYLATASEVPDADYTPEDERYLLHVWLMRPRDLIKEACQRLDGFPGSNSHPLYCPGQ